MKNIIYGLRDPRNDNYYYIGKSTVGESRPLSHLKQSHSDKVNEWVANIRKNGFEPQVDIIEEIEDINKLVEREKYWVGIYSSTNPMILNEYLKPRKNNINTIYFSIDDRKEVKLLDESLPRLYLLLRKARKARKISQSEMAKICGVSLGTLKRLENGETNVSLSNFLKYLKIVGYNVDNILSTQNENIGVTEG